MLSEFDPQILLGLLSKHWVSGLFFLLTLVTLVLILTLRILVKRRMRRLLVEEMEEEGELDLLTPLGPRDHDALALVKEMRREIWELPDAQLQLNMEVLNQKAFQVVRSIAAIYHPEKEAPQYEASLFEMLQLMRRIVSRIQRMAGVAPFKYLGTRKLSDYQRYYDVYRKINENPVLLALKNHPTIFKLARWAMNLKNLTNPIYWASRELSREGYFFMVRWFHLTFVSQVGREAIRLYSGRHFQSEADRDGVLVFYRLFALTRQWGGPTGVDWKTLVEFLTGHSGVEVEGKLHILSRWSQNRLPKNLDEMDLQTALGRKWYRKGLKLLLDKDEDTVPGRQKIIEAELARLKEKDQ